jgi:dipeptidyl aminopeptidase/acylaminoacyl peptidase
VRIEVETALRHENVVLIPVLVQGVSMPNSADLPPSLRNLAYHNAGIVRDDPDFHRDMNRLIKQIEMQVQARTISTAEVISSAAHRPMPKHEAPRPVVKPAAKRRIPSWTWMAALLVLLVATAALFIPRILPASSGLAAISPDNAPQLSQRMDFNKMGVTGSAAWSPDGAYLAVPTFQEVNIFAANDLTKSLFRFTDHQTQVNAAAFSEDGKLLLTGGDKPDSPLRLWDVSKSQLLHEFAGLDNIRQVAISPDEKFVMGKDDNYNVVAWEAESGNLVFAAYDAGNFSEAVFARRGAILAVPYDDYSVRVWDLNKIKSPDDEQEGIIAYLEGHSEGIGALAFSPDGTLLATGGYDWGVHIYDVATGQKQFLLERHENHVYALAFSPDGKLLASGGEDHTVRLWNVENGQEIAVLGHADAVVDVAFNPDGKLLATAANDTRIHIWDTTTYSQVGTLDIGAYPASVAFSPDGTLLLANGQGTVSVWGVQP